jgi:hypothetical protein
VRLYNILEYALLAYFFSLHIKNSIVKYLLVFSAIPFAIFGIINYSLAKEPVIPFIPLTVEYVVLLIFIIYFFFEVMQDVVVEPIYHRAVFWISVAFIIAFSGNFFLFIYSKNSFNNEAFQRQYTIIYSSVTLLKNLLLCVGVSIREKKKNGSGELRSPFENYQPFQNLN